MVEAPVVWVGTVIGLFVGAIATAFGTGVGQGLLFEISNLNSADGPPVKIHSAQDESPEAAALSFAFGTFIGAASTALMAITPYVHPLPHPSLTSPFSR